MMKFFHNGDGIINSERVIEKFLIFPKSINGEIRWLEKAKYKQSYTQVGLTDYKWIDLWWVD